MAITAVSASTVARFLCRRCDVTGAVIVVASHSVLRQIAKPIGHVVTREIPGNDIDEFPVRIDQVVEAAVIDSIIAPALRMRGETRYSLTTPAIWSAVPVSATMRGSKDLR